MTPPRRSRLMAERHGEEARAAEVAAQERAQLDAEFAAMGRSVYEAMRAGDPEAVWVMQGWIFINAPNFWKPPQARAFLGFLRTRIWSSPASSPALAGDPVTRVLSVEIDSPAA